MAPKGFVVAAMIAATICPFARGQENATDYRPRVLLESEFGTAKSLGFKLPSTSFGPKIEIPLKKRFEFQARASYSPDRKYITNDGNSLGLGGSAIGFVNTRLGFIGSVGYSWLWTSQFEDKGWTPSAGLVIRNDAFGAGRLYVTYLLPTGCVWATPTNPCTMQSKRTQGIQVAQDVRNGSHKRWGFNFGLYHFCDQGNQNEPQAGRNCHWGGTAMVTASLEFHLGKLLPSALKPGVAGDNF